jgi:RHS repeat-associated protein
VGGLGHPSEDETGLVYMRARWMDPVIGRFASEDPARQNTNWFIYARNNPTRYVDPDGKADIEYIRLIVERLESNLNFGLAAVGDGRLGMAMLEAIRNLKAALLTPSAITTALGEEIDDALMQLGRLQPIQEALGRIRGVMIQGGRAGALSAATWQAYHELMAAFGYGSSAARAKLPRIR